MVVPLRDVGWQEPSPTDPPGPAKELVSEPCSQGVGHRGTTVVGGDGS